MKLFRLFSLMYTFFLRGVRKIFLLSLRPQNTYVNQVLLKQWLTRHIFIFSLNIKGSRIKAIRSFYLSIRLKIWYQIKIISVIYAYEKIYRLNIIQISSFQIVSIIINLLEKSSLIKSGHGVQPSLIKVLGENRDCFETTLSWTF